MGVETWILILWMTQSRAVAVHSIEFNTKSACETAQDKWRGDLRHATLGAMCVKK